MKRQAVLKQWWTSMRGESIPSPFQSRTPPLPFWLVRLKPALITDKTSLLQTKAHDISFDKSILLQCGGDSRSLRASSIEQSPKSFLASYMYMGKLCSHCALGLKSVPAILWLQTCKMEIRDRQHAKNVPEDSFVLRAARNGSVDLVKNCIKRGCTMYVTLTTNQLKV